LLVDGIHDLSGIQGLGRWIIRRRNRFRHRPVLAGMRCPLPEEVEIRAWDSSAEVRYLVLPQRPPATEVMTGAELAALVTRDSMIGVARL
jgi:nitrile hydratase